MYLLNQHVSHVTLEQYNSVLPFTRGV